MEGNKTVKEEGKIKSWMKKHKTALSVGGTALLGVGLAVVSYRMGYDKGLNQTIKAIPDGQVMEF